MRGDYKDAEPAAGERAVSALPAERGAPREQPTHPDALGREVEAAHQAERRALEARVSAAEAAARESEDARRQLQLERAREVDLLSSRLGFERAADQTTERLSAPTSGGRQDAGGRTELNSVTVEGLRALGLSITQAARLVAHREATGGFRSAEDIAPVPGLSAGQRQALVERVYVDPTLAGATPR